MQNVKNKLTEYLNNEISLEELNTYFRKNVPYSGNNRVEDVRIAADLTVEGELTPEQKEDELIDESTLKKQIQNLLKDI